MSVCPARTRSGTLALALCLSAPLVCCRMFQMYVSGESLCVARMELSCGQSLILFTSPGWTIFLVMLIFPDFFVSEYLPIPLGLDVWGSGSMTVAAYSMWGWPSQVRFDALYSPLVRDEKKKSWRFS